MPRKLTQNEFVEKAIKIHGNKYDYSKVDYKVNYIKVEIICLKHGPFFQTPNSHLNNRGCMRCKCENQSKFQRSNTDDFIKKAKLIHGDRYDYSKVDYVNCDTKTKITCKIHGSFYKSPTHHLMGEGCFKCSDENFLKLVSNNTDDFIKKAKLIHGDRYDYSKSNYIKRHGKVEIICKIHGMFSQIPGDHLNNHGCPKCVHKISKPEIEFLDYLKIPNTIENRQKRIKSYRTDGFDSNIVYEFLGDYYHGNPKIFNSNDYNSTCHKTFGKLYENTIDKFDFLKQNGYSVKYIWESDWKKFKNGIDIVPNIISYK